MSGAWGHGWGETVGNQSWGCAERLEKERKRSSPRGILARSRSAAFVVKPKLSSPNRVPGMSPEPVSPSRSLYGTGCCCLGLLLPMVVLCKARFVKKLQAYMLFGLFHV